MRDRDEVGSPCNAICQLDKNKQYCLGCYRTIEEIAQWRNLSAKEKLAIIDELPMRRKHHE